MMSPRPLGDDADDQLGRVVDRERRLGRGDRRGAVDELDLELARRTPAAGRTGGYVLSDWVGRSTDGPEPGPALGAAGRAAARRRSAARRS